jgi:hypothetical protein
MTFATSSRPTGQLPPFVHAVEEQLERAADAAHARADVAAVAAVE